MRATLLMAGGLAAALAAGPGRAEEAKRLDPVVITATKGETPSEQLGAAVTVLTEEDLRLLLQQDTGEALRPVPGVEIQRSGSPGKESSIRIRGATPNQVQVLVDGLRVKSPTLGTVDLSELSLDAVDRIEIIRGPQAGLYGADAIGGVVNIITRKGEGRPRAFAHVEGGSHQTFRQRVGVQGAHGPFNYNLSGSHYDTDGQFDNDESSRWALAGRLGWDFPWGGELSLTGRYAKLELELPVHDVGPPVVLDPNSRQQTETWLYTLTYTQRPFAWWDVRARYGEWRNNQGFQDAPPPPPPGTTFPDTPQAFQINTRRHEVELVNAFHPAPWTTLTLGAEYRSEHGHNKGAFRESIGTVGLFVQDELRFFDRLFLSGSLRWEDNDTFGDELTPRVSAVYAHRETGTRLRATWGRGFRAPTLNDLFFPGFANPDLRPERSRSWDVGLDQRLWQGRVRFGATYFHNDFEDLIQIQPAAACPPGNPFGCPGNVGRAESRGVETYLELEPLDWLLLSATYTFTDTEDEDTGQPLRRFARHRWAFGATLTPIPRLSLFARAHVVSRQFESSFAGHNPGWHRIDVGGTLQLLGRVGVMERLELTARIENLTDERYSEVFGFRALGFHALAGLRAHFP